jgi:hypothetical protein
MLVHDPQKRYADNENVTTSVFVFYPGIFLAHYIHRLAICSGWLLKTYLSTVTKRNSEDKTLYLHFTQPLQIAFVGRSCISPLFFV